MKMRLVVSLLVIFVLAACAPAPASPTAQPADTATPSAPPAATSTPLPTLTPTITPTPSPTPSYFVRDGTPVPQPAEAISPDNVSQIAELARWGKGKINDIEFSSDDEMMFVWTPLGVYAYDAATFDSLWKVEIPAQAHSVAYAHDRNIVAIGDREGNIHLHSLIDGRIIERWLADNSEIISLAFSNDSTMLASGHSYEMVIIWSIDNFQAIVQFEKQDFIYYQDTLHKVFFPRGDNTLAVETRDGLTVRSLDSAEVIWTLENSNGTYSDNLEFVAIVSGKSVEVYELVTGKLRQTLNVPEDKVNDPDVLTFSPDQSLLAAGYYHPAIIDIWSIQEGEIIHTLATTADDEASVGNHAREVFVSGPGVDRVDNLLFSADGSLLVSRNGYGNVDYWDMDSGLLNRTLEDMEYFVGLSLHNSTLTTWSYNYANKLDNVTGSQLVHLGGFIAGYEVEFSPDAKFFKSGSFLWNLDSNQETDTSSWPPFVDFADEGQSIVTVDGSTIKIIRISDLQVIRQVELEEPNTIECGYICVGGLTDSVVSPNSDFYLQIFWEGGFNLWSLEDGSWFPADSFMDTPPRQVAFSGDGNLMAAVNWYREQVVVYNLEEETKDFELSVSRGFPWDVDFASNAEILAVAADNSVIAWDISGTEILYHFLRPIQEARGIDKVAVSPDGILVAANSLSGKVMVWNIQSNELVYVIENQFGGIYDLTFSPDGRYLATASSDGTVRLWGIPPN